MGILRLSISWLERRGLWPLIFRQLLDDPDGKSKLCVVPVESSDGTEHYDLDPELTFLIWDDFIDKAISYYGFGSPELQETIVVRRDETAKTIKQAREKGSPSVNTFELEEQRRLDEASILAIRQQIARTEQIFEDHKAQLNDFLRYNRAALLQHFNTENRLTGFERDGENRQKVAVYVDSLREQVETIKQDRKKELNQWTYEVLAMWDSLESQINDLAVDAQAEKPVIRIHRPFDQKRSRLKLINQFIPWFDTVVGGLLIIGLFSRLSSLAAGGFLASVIATQPPWIPGTDPTYLYAIELAACIVIFATCAGRFGGLDYFISRKSRRTQIESQEQQ
jgi:uncharacterized membrane protein YphA (DoxX/SURF4 family)